MGALVQKIKMTTGTSQKVDLKSNEQLMRTAVCGHVYQR